MNNENDYNSAFFYTLMILKQERLALRGRIVIRVKYILLLLNNQIKLLTYNMFLRPLVNTNESDYKYERLDVFTKHYIEEFDIVCLQEVFEGFNSFKATLISKASEVGFIDSAIPTRPGFFDSNAIDGGLVILSKFSIVESDSIVFKYWASDWILSSKGCIYAKVYVHGNFVHVFNTHLQASYYTTFETYKEWINSRLYQWRELAKFIDLKTKDASSEDIIILCGDFNISSNVLSPVLIKQFTEFAHTDERFSIFLDPGFDSLKEYKTMIDLLSWNSFQIIDLKEHLNDENGGPPTFGGVEVDHDGIKFPIESVITGESDLMTEQSIDYIFQFKRKYEIQILSRELEDNKKLNRSRR